MFIIRIILALIGLMAIISIPLAWVASLYYAITSKNKEIQNSRVLWIFLIILTGPLGATIFFFVDGHKREGIISLVSVIILPFILVLYSILAFVTTQVRTVVQDDNFGNRVTPLEQVDQAGQVQP